MAHMATGKARVSLPQSWVDIPDRGYLELHYPDKQDVGQEINKQVTEEVSNKVTANNKVLRSEFAAADNTVRGEFAAEDTAIRKEFAAADNTVRGEFAAEDTKINTKVDNVINGTTKVENAKSADIAINLQEGAKIGNYKVDKVFTLISHVEHTKGWKKIANLSRYNLNDTIIMEISSDYTNYVSQGGVFAITKGFKNNTYGKPSITQLAGTTKLTDLLTGIRIGFSKDNTIDVLEINNVQTKRNHTYIRLFCTSDDVTLVDFEDAQENNYDYFTVSVIKSPMAVNGVPVATTESTIKTATPVYRWDKITSSYAGAEALDALHIDKTLLHLLKITIVNKNDAKKINVFYYLYRHGPDGFASVKNVISEGGVVCDFVNTYGTFVITIPEGDKEEDYFQTLEVINGVI